MSEYIKKYIENEKIKNDIIDEISSKTDYINWVINYSKNKKEFYSDDYFYHFDILDEESKTNIEHLCFLYDAIDRYSNKNYIYPTTTEFGNYYKIKYNNQGFQIGFMAGQGIIFYCKKCQIDDSFLDFNDLINNKKQKKVEAINNNLKQISDKIISAYNSGASIDAINDTINQTLNNLTKKDKVLIKKIASNDVKPI